MTDRNLEACISTRSYLIWQREGCPIGHDREYWDRARAEIESELRHALEDGGPAFVPPRLDISRRPLRHVA